MTNQVTAKEMNEIKEEKSCSSYKNSYEAKRFFRRYAKTSIISN